MRLRRGRRDHEEADQDQAKILKVLMLYCSKIDVLFHDDYLNLISGYERYC